MHKLSNGNVPGRILSGVGLALCMVVFVSCTRSADVSATRGAAGAVEVVTAAARLQNRSVEIEAVGTALANESVQVTAKVANTVSAIGFQEGHFVRKGDILVRLDDRELRAAVREAEAVLNESEAQFERSRPLAQQHILSDAQLEQLEATRKTNRARLDAARARLADTVIRAGFDGRTGFRRVSVGSLVTPGTVITTLDDVSIIKVEFTVPETYLFLLERGLGVNARTPGLPGRSFKGTVSTLDSRIEPATRSVSLRAEVPNADGALRPGMFMTVAVNTAATPALLVPEEAIVPEQGNTFVFVVADGTVERRRVRTGRRWPGEVELLSGLQAGERVVVQGTQSVRAGMAVRELAAAQAAGPS
ncbi:MAG TPA: efflux RND transporter periplasmic adaptor subunit [Steroidobacteraceae bacterium]|nr:efflux RND transporter periplasmic adaptor subunit [Steroidobacteraceae bacterium]